MLRIETIKQLKGIKSEIKSLENNIGIAGKQLESTKAEYEEAEEQLSRVISYPYLIINYKKSL